MDASLEPILTLPSVHFRAHTWVAFTERQTETDWLTVLCQSRRADTKTHTTQSHDTRTPGHEETQTHRHTNRHTAPQPLDTQMSHVTHTTSRVAQTTQWIKGHRRKHPWQHLLLACGSSPNYEFCVARRMLMLPSLWSPPSTCIDEYKNVFVYVYGRGTYIYICIYTRTNINILIYTYMYICVCVCVYIYIYIYIYM